MRGRSSYSPVRKDIQELEGSIFGMHRQCSSYRVTKTTVTATTVSFGESSQDDQNSINIQALHMRPQKKDWSGSVEVCDAKYIFG